eukprot:g1788.t1
MYNSHKDLPGFFWIRSCLCYLEENAEAAQSVLDILPGIDAIIRGDLNAPETLEITGGESLKEVELLRIALKVLRNIAVSATALTECKNRSGIRSYLSPFDSTSGEPSYTKYGMLKKLGGISGKQWQNRWVELRGRALVYRQSQDSEVKGSLMLNGCHVVQHPSDNRQFRVELKVASQTSKKTTYSFQARNEVERFHWINAINGCISVFDADDQKNLQNAREIMRFALAGRRATKNSYGRGTNNLSLEVLKALKEDAESLESDTAEANGMERLSNDSSSSESPQTMRFKYIAALRRFAKFTENNKVCVPTSWLHRQVAGARGDRAADTQAYFERHNKNTMAQLFKDTKRDEVIIGNTLFKCASGEVVVAALTRCIFLAYMQTHENYSKQSAHSVEFRHRSPSSNRETTSSFSSETSHNQLLQQSSSSSVGSFLTRVIQSARRISFQNDDVMSVSRAESKSISSKSPVTVERDALVFARNVMLAASRTVTGGDSYDAVELLFRSDLVAICPDGTKVYPIVFEVIPQDDSEDSSEDKALESWPLIKVTAKNYYKLMNMEPVDPNDLEWAGVETTFTQVFQWDAKLGVVRKPTNQRSEIVIDLKVKV